MNDFLGRTTDANENTPNAMGPVMASAGDGPGGKLRGMPMKLTEADLFIAGPARGAAGAQKMINTLQPSRTTSDEVRATPSTPWAQQFEQRLQ
jgi:hypothetical protein